MSRPTSPRRAWLVGLLLGVPWAAVPLAVQAQPIPATPAATPAAETPQVKRGRLLFLQCRACHELQPTGAALVGPHLGGVFGRKVAGVAGFGYSAALAAQGFTWDRTRLDQWLERPGAVVPGNAMAFAGIPSAPDRAALLDFLEVATAPR